MQRQLNSITIKYKKDKYELRLKCKMKKNLIGFRNNVGDDLK